MKRVSRAFLIVTITDKPRKALRSSVFSVPKWAHPEIHVFSDPVGRGRFSVACLLTPVPENIVSSTSKKPIKRGFTGRFIKDTRRVFCRANAHNRGLCAPRAGESRLPIYSVANDTFSSLSSRVSGARKKSVYTASSTWYLARRLACAFKVCGRGQKQRLC